MASYSHGLDEMLRWFSYSYDPIDMDSYRYGTTKLWLHIVMDFI